LERIFFKNPLIFLLPYLCSFLFYFFFEQLSLASLFTFICYKSVTTSLYNSTLKLDTCEFSQFDESQESFLFDLNYVSAIEVHNLVDCENENSIPNEADNC
ncbi:hypothetical protein LINGRAHAP2_LOCUS22816, partial [Linum grandiflorum]